MNAITVEFFLRGLALRAEIEMAKAANAVRADQGYAPAYGEEVFDDIRNRLEQLANQLLLPPKRYRRMKTRTLNDIAFAEGWLRETAAQLADELVWYADGPKHPGDCQFTDKADEGCYLCKSADQNRYPGTLSLIARTRQFIQELETKERASEPSASGVRTPKP